MTSINAKWTATNQAEALQQANNFKTEYQNAMEAWVNSIQANPANINAAVPGALTDVLQRWNQFVSILQSNSDSILSDENTMETSFGLLSTLADKKRELASLRNKAITRADQADSVNPKIRSSPYTNLFGLHRVFRDSTRQSLLITSIVFGLGTLAAGGLLFKDVVLDKHPLFPENIRT